MHSFFPLFSWRSPTLVWEENPSFLVAEIVLFLGVACSIRIVARNKDLWSRVLVLAALTGGATIELLTIMEPQIGNFYHSQASLMLFGLREPVYMLLYYIFFQWAAISLAWQLNFSIWGEAAFACLVGSLLHQLLDQVGLAYLWWTWHNDEPLYRDRSFGVPIASTFWVSSTLLALSICIRVARMYTPTLSSWPKIVGYGIILGPLAAVGVMNGPFIALYHPLVTVLGLHASFALHSLRALCTLKVLYELWLRAQFVKDRRGRYVIPLLCACFVAFLAFVIHFFDASQITRSSFGQPFGPCDATEGSFWGAFQRRATVCAETASARDRYDFHCIKPGASFVASPLNVSTAWYSVCGVRVGQEDQFHALGLFVSVVLLALVAVFFAAPIAKRGKKQI